MIIAEVAGRDRFLANFKRGNGDNMGVAGGLNDRCCNTWSYQNLFIPMDMVLII
ncbi:MAG: hypothetical protein WKF59_04205 [Chitinophagaceae bacterium]